MFSLASSQSSIAWLIRMRWVVAGLLAASSILAASLGIVGNLHWLILTAGAVALSNTLYLLAGRRWPTMHSVDCQSPAILRGSSGLFRPGRARSD